MASVYLIFFLCICAGLCIFYWLRGLIHKPTHSRWQERSRNSRDGFKSRVGAK